MEVKLVILMLVVINMCDMLYAKHSVSSKCDKASVTSASGTKAPQGPYCPGDLIFEDTFDTFDVETWKHENTLAGGGNWEFQWYTNNRSNSFVEGGKLNIRPTLTADEYGEAFLRSGALNLHGGAPADQCTNPSFYGCERAGSNINILNPVKSARLRTVDTFAFKYGKVEVSAKIPTGDWLWPAIWFLPKNNAYGTWPASGEIDLMEARGNRELIKNGLNIGVEEVSATLHFGPNQAHNGYPTSTFTRNSETGIGFNTGFNRYQMEWTPEKITFSINDIETGTVKSGSGFWQRGNFNITAPGMDNPWKLTTKMAPFDQEFYFIINLAVGGVNFFPDDAINQSGKKPWTNNSPQSATDFWNGKNSWLPTWKLNVNKSKEASLLVDYVRVWAL